MVAAHRIDPQMKAVFQLRDKSVVQMIDDIRAFVESLIGFLKQGAVEKARSRMA